MYNPFYEKENIVIVLFCSSSIKNVSYIPKIALFPTLKLRKANETFLKRYKHVNLGLRTETSKQKLFKRLIWHKSPLNLCL